MRPTLDAAEPSTPDLQDLRAFCQVVDLGSVTAAAKALGETKGSVSRRVSRLERALGVVLVQRSPRRVEPTEDGAAYRARVGRALELLDDAAAQAQQARAAPRGHLRVTAPTDLGLSVVAPLLAGFGERCPDVTVEMLLTEARLDFDAHQLDVAIRAAPSLQDSSLVAHELLELATGFYAAPSYVAKHGAPRTPGDLAKHRVVVGVFAQRGQATLTVRRKRDGEETTVRVRAAVSSPDFSLCREAAAGGAGVVLAPVAIVARDVEAGRLVPVLEPYAGFTAAMYLIHQGSRFMQPKVAAFRDYMLEAFGARKRR